MPIFEFRCPHCRQTYEHFYGQGEVALGVSCPVCGVNCPKVPSRFRPDTFGVMEADRASKSSGLDIQSRSDLKRRGLELVDRRTYREMKEANAKMELSQPLSRREIEQGVVEGIKRLENRDYVREVNIKRLTAKARLEQDMKKTIQEDVNNSVRIGKE